MGGRMSFIGILVIFLIESLIELSGLLAFDGATTVYHNY